MSDRLATLGYSANERRRIAPSRSDWYIALFTIIAVIAGLIAFTGIASVVIICVKPTWVFDPSEPVPWWFIVISFAIYGGALALAFFAARLARRRARPAR